MNGTEKKLILVVCWGNIFRSPIAEILINRELDNRKLGDEYYCLSRGIQGSADVPSPQHSNLQNYVEFYSKVYAKLSELCIMEELCKHQSRPVTQNIIQSAYIIVAMGQDCIYGENTLEKPENAGLISQFSGISEKIVLLSIDDPHTEESTSEPSQLIEIIFFKVQRLIQKLDSLSTLSINIQGLREV